MTTTASVTLPRDICFPFAHPRTIMQHGTKRSCSFDNNADEELAHKRIRTASTQLHTQPHASDNGVLYEGLSTFTSNPTGRDFVPRATAATATMAASATFAQEIPAAQFDLQLETADDDDSTPRIVDLSTGDVLERAHSPKQPTSRQKGKRTLDEDNGNVKIIQTLMVSETNRSRVINGGDPSVDLSPPNKKFRTNEAVAHHDYFVEEVDEEEDDLNTAGLANGTVDNQTLEDVSTIGPFDDNGPPAANSDSASLVLCNRNGKVWLALPCHKAFTSYMRSQFANLGDGMWTNKDKQMVVYRSRLLESNVQTCPRGVGTSCSDVTNSQYGDDMGCRIYEITEEDGEVDMVDAAYINLGRVEVQDNSMMDDQRMDID